MNLRRVRIQLTVLYGTLAAVAIIALALFAVRTSNQRITDGAERSAEQQVEDLSVSSLRTEASADNTWYVDLDSDFTDAYGDTWVEPPLFTLAEQGQYGPHFDRFEQDGRWLAYARPLSETEVIVTAVSFTEFDDEISSVRFRVTLAAGLLLAAVVGIGWFVSGRALRPARAAFAQQRDFIADAAHELRTPLAVVQASSSHALSRPRDAGDYREALEEIRVAAARAGASVSELLELARVDAGQFEPRRAPLRLDLLAEEVAAAVRVDGVEIVAAESPKVVADADHNLLRQAIDNVVRNAAARAARVEVAVSGDARHATVEVRDDGPGFAPEVVDSVFDRFRRGDERGSSGLGLSIVRSIVDAHGGQCSAHNDPAGGAVVTLSVAAAAQDDR